MTLVDGKRLGDLMNKVNRAGMQEFNKGREQGEALADIMARVHRANMKSLERHAPCEPMTAALVMEAYSEFLDGDFQKQMTEKYGIEYPLDMTVIDKTKL